ncbi:Prenylated Rab acceptor 1 [Wickerhamiella sorbophila]|uniref:PRA1 family protein n=1 Tax=Wickerhamiella sorbophila TaxID=45607 RepID=A0A2T0FNN0_9ASCO|nr:Prenylated Rab acceptor 1 [Wickerhamiella sorbophila]PRT56601.1 Prenylated Rab acceptor 1 [Wickerhamiella sorbophila]
MSFLSRVSFALPSNLSLDNLRAESSSIRNRLSNVKGVREFFAFNRLSRPEGWGDAQARIAFNLSYFSSNYLMILVMLSLYSLLTNPLLLFVLFLGFGGFMTISALGGQDLVTPFGTITSQSLYIGLGVIVVPLFIIASPLATLFWLIGAAGVTILGHAALLEKPLESEFADQV